MTNKKPLFAFLLILIFMNIDIAAQTKVDLIKTPNGGIQPKVKLDSNGQLHLIYYKGSNKAGNLFYVKKPKGGEFTQPIQVNSTPNSAVSIGTIRGAQFALGNSNIIHVVWNSSNQAKPAGNPGPGMYYASLAEKATKFETQKIVSGKWVVDGGGSVAADAKGNVFTFFHSGAGPKGGKEKDRKVFISILKSGKKKFSKPRAISPALGVCGCCAMQATCDSEGNVYAVYRTATNNKSRDINLLVSKSKGKKFSSKVLDKWPLNKCPMSSMAFCETPKRMIIGWETNKQIRYTTVAKGSVKAKKFISPKGGSKGAKHPVFALSPDEKVLVAWTEGTGWKKGGSIAWQELDSSLKSVSKTKRKSAGVTVWSFIATCYDPETKTFSIYH